MNILFESRIYQEKDYQNILEKYNCNQGNPKRVAVIMRRSPELIFAIYQLFKSGITYIPIDPNNPIERIEFILNESKPDVVLSDDPTIFNCTNEKRNAGIDLAYILYTSGTTGNPKGVGITKENLINFVHGITDIIDFSANKRIACLTTISFDIFFLESIMALSKGITVVLANEEEQRNPKLMAQLIENNEVEMIQMTPSRMQLLLNHDKELLCLKNVKEIMIGGEPFPLSLLRSLQAKTTAKIYNMYGPTETTIWSTVSELTYKDRIDIGRPITNTEIYIVDEGLSILQTGQSGEICIAGSGLANGYVEREDLTAKKFIYLPQKPDVMVYRTGDMGRYLPDGELEYLGRTDNQVKIRGHRIELEEIESHLNQLEGIKQSIVIALETSETDKILQAFYTSDFDIKSKIITSYLSEKLPSYMVPVVFKHVESFIQTENGKIDRKRVLECVEIKVNDSVTESFNKSELNAIQKKAFEVIVSTLGSKIGDVTIETEITGAGVDSITFIKIVVALEGEFDFEFDDEMLLITKFPTIKTMLDYTGSKIKEMFTSNRY